MRTRLLLVASAMGAGALLLACTPPGGGGSTTTTTTSSTTTTVVAGTPPTAVIGASVTSGTAHLPVDFTGSGSTDDGTIVSYAWNFGDGDTSTAADPHHVFTQAGSYNVTLTVTDNSAQTDSDSVTITVTDDANGRYVATTGTDTGDCSDSTAPCLTVQYATDQADASGDTVYVDAGAYPEVVYVTKDVTFKGINQGLEGDGGRGAESIVKGIRTGANAAQAPGTVQRSVTFVGFQIDPQGDAALISASYKPLVWLIGGASTVVENNVFVGGASYDPDCNSACTPMTDVGLEVRSGAVSISDNSFTIFRRAAWLYQTAPAGTVFTSASVTDNTFTRFTSIGLRIAPSGGNPLLPGVTVDGNEFDNTNGGIGTSSPGGVVVTGGDNTFTNNRFDAVASGIYLYVCSAYPVGAQTISGNDVTNAGAGVNVLAENPGCATGDITGTTITQNDFNSNVFFGVVGSYFSAGQPNIAATCNWWDTPSGPNTTGAQAPTTGITTSPWLVDTTDNSGACTGV